MTTDNALCPDFTSHSENAADLLSPETAYLIPRIIHDPDLNARIDALAEAMYRECEGHE